MRAVLALALIAGGALVALPDPADARRSVRKAPHYAQPRAYQPRYYRQRSYGYRPRAYGPGYYYAPPPAPYISSERLACEERAWADDPTGLYAGYPCWARSAFGRGGGPGRR
jgi:hypothetical protein